MVQQQVRDADLLIDGSGQSRRYPFPIPGRRLLS